MQGNNQWVEAHSGDHGEASFVPILTHAPLEGSVQTKVPNVYPKNEKFCIVKKKEKSVREKKNDR